MSLGEQVRGSVPDNYKPLLALLTGKPASAAKRLEEADAESADSIPSRVHQLERSNEALTQQNEALRAEVSELRKELGAAVEYFARIAAAEK